MDATRNEEWRAIPGYEGLYEVSDRGRVRSLDRMRPFRGGWRPVRGRVLSPWMSRYWNVRLSREGVVTAHSVHSLVAAAFIGPRPDGMHVCHNDGDRNNNSVGNLRYDTPSANSLDVVKHGNHYLANRTHCSQGHEYTPENTVHFPSAPRARKCRKCIDAHNQELIAAKSLRAPKTGGPRWVSPPSI